MKTYCGEKNALQTTSLDGSQWATETDEWSHSDGVTKNKVSFNARVALYLILIKGLEILVHYLIFLVRKLVLMIHKSVHRLLEFWLEQPKLAVEVTRTMQCTVETLKFTFAPLKLAWVLWYGTSCTYRQIIHIEF